MKGKDFFVAQLHSVPHSLQGPLVTIIMSYVTHQGDLWGLDSWTAAGGDSPSQVSHGKHRALEATPHPTPPPLPNAQSQSSADFGDNHGTWTNMAGSPCQAHNTVGRLPPDV